MLAPFLSLVTATLLLLVLLLKLLFSSSEDVTEETFTWPDPPDHSRLSPTGGEGLGEVSSLLVGGGKTFRDLAGEAVE